jgi:hypothetical protein
MRRCRSTTSPSSRRYRRHCWVGAGHALPRLSGHDSELRRVLDVVGMGMLVPMPLLSVSGTYVLLGCKLVR